MGNMRKKFGEDWTCTTGDMLTDRQIVKHTDTVITILRSSIKGGVMGHLHDAAVAAIVGAIVGATRRTSVYKRQLSARLSAQLKAVAPIDRADSCMSVYVQNTLDKPDQTLSVGDPAVPTKSVIEYAPSDCFY